jgi:hypothetical protein
MFHGVIENFADGGICISRFCLNLQLKQLLLFKLLYQGMQIVLCSAVAEI